MSTHNSDRSLWTLFLIFLRLGLTSFGGPVAHLGYFRDEFIDKKRWLTESAYANLVALCQFLPGPSSSQVGMALGFTRAGYTGAIIAWAGFTLPSAVIMIILALGLTTFGEIIPYGTLTALKIVAVAIVAEAVWEMGKKLCRGWLPLIIMATACSIALAITGTLGQIGTIVIGGIIGRFWIKVKNDPQKTEPVQQAPGYRRTGIICLTTFIVLLIGLPAIAHVCGSQPLAAIDAFYRTGSLVFGGGHVVLPLLQAEVVHSGWVDNQTFMTGYAAAQALPGPLFTFAAFLGTSMDAFTHAWIGGVICLIAIFLPSLLLIAGVMPFWYQISHNVKLRTTLAGINAAVVGLLLAALYNPVWTSAIHTPWDAIMALAVLIILVRFKPPVWLIVLTCGIGGAFF